MSRRYARAKACMEEVSRMGKYLDIDDAVADHPRAKQELERLRERAKLLYPSDERERESVCMCSACRNPMAIVFDSEAVLCGVPCECGRGNYLPVYAWVAVDEIRRLREALTPSAETKAVYMGEFSVPLPLADDDGEEFIANINVPWIVIKKMMAAIRKQAFANRETNS